MTKAIVDLAAEYWKLVQYFKRAIELAPEQARARMEAQVRYAESRMEAILATQCMRVLSFDGMPFEPNMPAVAINADEFHDLDALVVERTLEPAVVKDMDVLVSGKVYLTKTE